MSRRVRSWFSRTADRILYRVARTVPAYSEPAANHIGSRSFCISEIHAVHVFLRCDVWHRYSVAFKNAVVRETIECPDRTEYCYPSLRRYPRVQVRGTVTTIGDLWPSNYYHKLIDMIPKVFALHDGHLRDEEATLVLDDRFGEADLEILSALVPASVRFERLPSMRRVTCDKYVHLPRLSVDPSKPCKNVSEIGHLPPAYLAFFRKRLEESFGIEFGRVNRDKRIFISRQDAMKRRMVNEDEIADYLAREHGFERVSLGRMTPLEQARLFADASVVVGQHGAGLTNLIFMPRGARVIEVFSVPGEAPSHYSSARTLVGFSYDSVSMRPVGQSDRSKDLDGSLDRHELSRILDRTHDSTR